MLINNVNYSDIRNAWEKSFKHLVNDLSDSLTFYDVCSIFFELGWVACAENNKDKKDMNSDKQLEIDKRYLRMARIWAENSYCTRRKVGALIVKDRMIISDGYNGTPSGFENVCELEDGTTKSYVLHAEANAITKIAKSGNNSDGATLYVTMSPCMECAKLIIQSGIKRVVYCERYRIDDGIRLLTRAGIECVFIEL